MLKTRMAVSAGGPDGQSSWFDSGETYAFIARTVNTTDPQIPLQSIAPADLQLAGGMTQVDVLATNQPIQRLNGAQLCMAAVLAAQATLTLGISVLRNFGPLAVAAPNGVAVTSITLKNPLSVGLANGQVLTITNAAGSTPETVTTSAAVAAGATVVPIQSWTPTASYAIGNPVVGTVGNGPCFGWQNGAGGGTPTFAAYNTYSLPAIKTNPAVITPASGNGSYVFLLPGDVIVWNDVLSAATLSQPAGTLQPLIA